MTKKKTSIALDENLISWIDKKIRQKYFASRTHAIEFSLQRVKDQMDKEEVEALEGLGALFG